VVVVVELLGAVAVALGGVDVVVDCAAAVVKPPDWRRMIAQTLAPPTHRGATHRGTRALVRFELMVPPA
jgi:hypothetical protein